MPATPRCLVPDLALPVHTLPAETRRHLVGALRLRPGDELELVDGCGGLARGRLLDAGTVEVVERAAQQPPPTAPTTLAVAVPRPSRLDWLVEKAVELNVSRLVPLETRHGERGLSEARRTRLVRLADEALLQCRRLQRLTITASATVAATLAAAAAAAPPPEIWLGSPPAGPRPADPVPPPRPPSAPLLILVGPEGGFDADEQALIAQAGARRVQLGDTVLRVETAAVALAALAEAARHPAGEGGSLR